MVSSSFESTCWRTFWVDERRGAADGNRSSAPTVSAALTVAEAHGQLDAFPPVGVEPGGCEGDRIRARSQIDDAARRRAAGNDRTFNERRLDARPSRRITPRESVTYQRGAASPAGTTPAMTARNKHDPCERANALFGLSGVLKATTISAGAHPGSDSDLAECNDAEAAVSMTDAFDRPVRDIQSALRSSLPHLWQALPSMSCGWARL